MYEEAGRLVHHCIQVHYQIVQYVSTNKVVPADSLLLRVVHVSSVSDAIASIPNFAGASSSRTDRVKTCDVGVFVRPNLL